MRRLVPLKLVDRYLSAELTRAVAGGVLLFWGVLFCVYELQHLIKFLVRKGYPPDVVGKLFLYYLPQDLGWVLPIAIVFGVIAAIGRLSGDGEVIAMHAGGISFRRLLVPVALVGLLGVGAMHLLTDVLGPPGLSRAADLVRKYGSPDVETKDFSYPVRDKNVIVRRVDAFELDPPTRTLKAVTVTEYRDGLVWGVMTAESANWEGPELFLHQVRWMSRGVEWSVEEAKCEVGEVPEQIDPTVRRPEEMTIGEMRRRTALLHERKADWRQEIRPLEQRIAVRRADPWCVLGLALVSAPLGIRRVRTTTGVSIGLAVLVFIPYYFVSFTLQVIGKHGGIHPEISAWTANVLLFVVAAGLILDSSR